MILSLDATMAFLLLIATISIFLQTSSNFEFSVREIVCQRFTDSLALALQKTDLLIELSNGNKNELGAEVEKVKGDYCIEITANEEKLGNCDDGQVVTRNFLVFNNGELIHANVETHFS
ncbi:MAG: hypothetical protein V1644_00705 [Candidatus Micrarchaeota archaeon]